MSIAEPMTVLTDWGLAAVGLAVAIRLRALEEGQLPRRLWAACFLAVALAAIAGGTSDGCAPRLADASRAALWLVTYGLGGLGNAFILAGAVVARAGGGRRMGLIGVVAGRF